MTIIQFLVVFFAMMTMAVMYNNRSPRPPKQKKFNIDDWRAN